ncbi:LacI family DNA-binding transcriptional regulator [Niallia nealsonii]|uniref:LacI family transcriptional regulator n=1 Tax=Niallia nealsonii TaxID=115979 RepID=A0A2N0YZ17_9BACI|nr:substrate-binding domain-containing protein [Niallia nealsonii]PKG22517.1 LacI family transcriptional regulator [Niallia nealsonii]
MKKVTMADVAQFAGVSKSTVSQYINNRYEYMGEETRIKIKEAIEKLGYQPNYIAKSLKQKRTAMIGIIVADIIHRFSTEVSRSIEDFCYDNDIHAIICNADNNPEKEKKYIDMLQAKQVDGLIIFPTGQNPALYKKMVDENYPVVFMDRDIKDLDSYFVLAENIQASYEAISHFIQHGHKHIAIVTQPLTISSRQERIEGYQKAMIEHHLSVDPDYIISGEIAELKTKLHALFQLKQPPTALLAGNDLVFLETLSFLQENKLHIPEDVSLIVFDNIPFAHLSNPPITIISQPAFEMGAKAAELLLRQINKETTICERVYFPCQLIIRTTSIKDKKS